jgi:hypothetical protein
MRKLTVLALLAIVVGAIIHFWPQGASQTNVPTASENSSRRPAGETPVSAATPSPGPPPSVLPAERTSPQATIEAPPAKAVRFALRAPPMARSGDSFSVTIDLQALRAIRHLEFAVTYKKSILRLLGSAPGAFAQQPGVSVQFEESSEGHLLVRVDHGSGAIGAGSIAVLEFQALRRGASPLAVQDVSYVEPGGQGPATTAEVFETSVLVE